MWATQELPPKKNFYEEKLPQPVIRERLTNFRLEYSVWRENWDDDALLETQPVRKYSPHNSPLQIH
jgi:hypothetical protein